MNSYEETIKTDAPGKFSCHAKNVKNGKTYAISVWSYHQENGEWFYTLYYDGVPKGGERSLSTNWVAESIFEVIISSI